ncbi:MAG TPA: asparagine synthase (glutamine-hydrolyzing) [Candidatus Paceibacterota bacterium]
MCAINGFNFKNESLIRKMNQATAHRGPDGTGVFLDGQISFGHNRLSILDTSDRAAQPMKSNDGNEIIIFNGEIYNFRELRKKLEASYQFKTTSDTEVIIAAYQKWGKECVKYFNGMFAFALWDEKKQELFLARDPIGIKPLYYFWDGKKFIFSSEIKAILETGVPRQLNKKALEHYFRVLYLPEPHTMFENIFKLPPAHWAVLKDKKLVIEQYWKVEDEKIEIPSNQKQLEEMVRNKVQSAVTRQLVSDRPLGVYLSGGIDSSVVLDCMSREHKNTDTFSVGFELPIKEDMEKFNQDFYLARKTAAHYGTRHHEIMLGEEEAINLFEKAVWHLDEPISNPTIIPMLHLAGFAKEKVAVVLGGDGGDELFGGYERYRLSRIASVYQHIPSFFRTALVASSRLQKLNTPAGVDRFSLFLFQKDDILKQVLVPEYINENTKQFFNQRYFQNWDKAMPFESHFMNVDRQSWLVDESLMRSDKMAMAAGLEQRVPLLDKEIVALAYQIPLNKKVSYTNTKIILKQAFADRIPKFLLNQPKRGWFSPGAKWLRHPKIDQMAREMLSPYYYSETQSLFNWDNLIPILKAHQEKSQYNFTVLWALLTFQSWARQYKIQL